MKPDPRADEKPEERKTTTATQNVRGEPTEPAATPPPARKTLDLRVHTVRREHDASGSH